ncbi:hypothetical protein PPSIR1_08466 [Plesiocystis pacifica SIR-1]|uniref:Tail specific protease domain-containing protein n=1 Tax=Plesiocystis pacifica SIR-1 TaxID=391625 RepID=A6GI45_9BACT|nr:S41 family peptidase [Plesiocystis pacifica]EDM74473.1 hypothetical protein PPSIR1_08466 [Plesiocystis pacifica SIR-1]
MIKSKMIAVLAGALGLASSACVEQGEDRLSDEANADASMAGEAEVPLEDQLSAAQIEACVELDPRSCDEAALAGCVGSLELRAPTAPGVSPELGCALFSDAQLAQFDVIEQYAADMRDYTGYAEAIDFELLEAIAKLRVILGGGEDYAFAKAIYGIFSGVPQGHASIGFVDLQFSDCYAPDGLVPGRGVSWYGVCARESGGTSLVTHVEDANPLGLEPGDRIIRARKGNQHWVWPFMLSQVRQEPLCDAATPSVAAQRDLDALHLFAHVDVGDELEVLHVDGTTEIIEVPERDDYTLCMDPFRRPSRVELFASYQRPDGVVVVELPTFGQHPDHPFPAPLTFQAYRDWNAEAVELVNAELAQYEDVAGLVWDIRGNRGGSAEYAMALLGGLGDAAGGLGNCYARVPGSQPPAFGDSPEYPFPYAIFVDQPLPTIGFDGPTAIVSDGAAGSAADWMMYRASELGIPTFGHATVGAFGYATGGSYVDKSIAETPDEHIAIFSRISGAHCLDAEGEPLEGRSFVEHVVDLDADDLAAGVDTQIEAAASFLLEQ